MKRRTKSKTSYKYNLKIYWEILRNYKGLAFILISAILILELTRIADKWIFKELIDKGALYLANELSRPFLVEALIGIALAFASLLVIKLIFKFVEQTFLAKLDVNLMRDIKRKFFNHLIHLSYEFHATHKKGSLISRLIRGSSAIERLTDVFTFNAIPTIAELIFVIVTVVYLDKLSALVMFIVFVLFISYSLFIAKKQQPAHEAANEAEDYEKGIISDVFTNVDSIKYFGKEENIKNRFKKISESTKLKVLKAWYYFRWLDTGHTLTIGIGTILVIYFPLMQFLDGNITLGSLTYIYTVYTQLISSLFGFVHGIREFTRSMVDFDDLFQYNKIHNDIKDPPHAKELKIKHGEIEFKDITFKYKNRNILSNFNLKISANTKVALVGPSGAGKSTIIRLLYRLYDINKGQILIDKNNIKNFKQESVRSELSIVPQEAILFDDTIYNNIAFSRPNATRDEVFQAMKFAQLDKVIKNFPNKENTIVGERGIKLSGGEKQRVSIARAILADKKVLVLDEATSSL